VSRYPAKDDRPPCLVRVEHLNQDFSNDGMIRRLSIETLQSAKGVCTDKKMSLLAVDEEKISVLSIKFSSEEAVKTVIVVELDVIYGKTVSLSLNIRSLIILSCMIPICENQFRGIPAVRVSACYAF
jgi:hypothetical protein